MSFSKPKITGLLAGLGYALASAMPVAADDSEIYLGALADTSTVRPNILLVIDTSGSMNSLVATKDPYDPAVTYPNQGCGNATARIYYRSGTGTPPSCGSGQWFDRSSQLCGAAQPALSVGGGGGPGTWTGKAAHWRGGGTRRWQDLRTGASGDPVECEVDAGNHGPNGISPLVYARDGDNSNRWTSNNAQKINWVTRNVHTLYASNWLNWYHWPGVGSTTRIQTVRAVVTNLINSIDNVNIGIMRFDSHAEGGMVIHPMVNVSTGRASLLSVVNPTMLPADSNTPLAETMYEAAKYWTGSNVDFGLTSNRAFGTPFQSVAGSRDGPGFPNRYKTPIEYQCQKNVTVLLTDGQPVSDFSVPSGGGRINSLPGIASVLPGGVCQAPDPFGGNGGCLDDIAHYLYQGDLNSTLAGQQNSQVHTVGFNLPGAVVPFLQATAAKGGGQYFDTTDAADLTTALQNIVADVLTSNTTFTSATISVNAFNRAQSLDELYVSVFKPDERARWRGNLKKYKLDNGVIKDSLNTPAVDSTTGFFADGTRSFWSPFADGRNADLGGAASQLPAPGVRKVYTHFASAGPALTAAGNALAVANANITDAILGTDLTAPVRANLIDWARGKDVADEDGDLNSTEARLTMGDPVHSRPAVVVYGGTTGTPDAHDTVVFVPTNEGFLHAISSNVNVPAVDGKELWAFMPQEMLHRLKPLYLNQPATSKDYGIDGDVRVLKYDRNQDGIVDGASGDKVFLFFGLRRGGAYYYGLDVTYRNAPQLLWKLSSAELPGLGEAWSTPTIARVKVNGAAQNAQYFTLIFGGGYDTVQENYDYAVDTVGNRIFMVDAVSGALVWYAGGTGSGADLELAQMNNSITGDIVATDLDGDMFADRMYATDLGGRIFRFDITNNNSRSSLVAGGAIAWFGAGGTGDPDIEDARRFYAGPDVSLIRKRGAAPFINIAVGSGYLGHPLHMATNDRFYSLRDKQPFAKYNQAQYDAMVPVLDGDMHDVTDDIVTPVPPSAPGWKLEMRLHGGWSGEKVLAESVTVNNVILVPTYQPTPPSLSNPCAAATGQNRLYALSVADGRPSIDFDEDGTVEDTERSTDLAQTGIAAEVAVVVDHDGTPVADPNDPSANTPTVCISGVEVLSRCVSIGGVGRTFWNRDGAP